MTEETRQSILVVDDEEIIRDLLAEVLEDYDVSIARDGQEALDRLKEKSYNLVITDLRMPNVSGEEVVKYAREESPQTQVIVISGYSSLQTVSQSITHGACAFLSKPFSIKELLARVKAVLLRGKSRDDGASEYVFGACRLDMDARLLGREGEDVPLTRTEFELLAYFCRNEGKALSRDVVMNDVWGAEYYGTQRSLDSFVANLRQKIEPAPHKPRRILTVHGVGYKFSTT